jgi:hypothetical protein
LGAWTTELARQIVLGTQQQMMNEQDSYEVFPAEDEDVEMPHGGTAEADHTAGGAEMSAAAGARPERSMTRSAAVIFEDRGPRVFENWRDVPPTLRSAIRKLHEQYSHALSGEDLARHVRLGGGAPRAIAAARLFRCERCAEAVRPPARPVACVPRYTRHNECLGIDILFNPI